MSYRDIAETRNTALWATSYSLAQSEAQRHYRVVLLALLPAAAILLAATTVLTTMLAA